MATVQLNIAGSDQSNPAFRSAVNNVQTLDNSVDRLTSRITSLAGAMGILYVSNKLWEGFTLGIKAVDDFQQSVIKTAAMITSLQGGENVAEHYRLAKEYAEGLQNTLMKVDANTSLNLQNLQSITEEMTKQGVILDTNNADQIEGFTRLANAAAVYSNNGKNEVQLRQEVRALLMGQVDQNSQLASMVQQMVQGPLQEQVNKWKQSGTLVVELGKALSGFGPASQDMATTWSAVKSSLETSVNLILRAGFGDIVKDIVGYVSKLNDYLKENKDMIGGEIKKGWEEFKSTAKTVADIAKAIYDNFEPFAAFFIAGALVKGIGSAVSLMKDLLAVATAARAVMITTGVLTAGAGVAGAAGAAGVAGGAVAGGGVMAAMGGGLLGSLGAMGAGVGLGYALQPAVRKLDEWLYNKYGWLLTGEAAFNEQEGKNQQAEAWLKWNRTENANYKGSGAAGPATPVVSRHETEDEFKKRIHAQQEELVAFKAMQESKTAIEKATNEVALAELKQLYAQGKVTTQEFYDEENRLAKDSAYEKYSNAVDYYNKEVDLLNAIAEKKGGKSAEYQAELAKNAKADEAVRLAELDMQKTATEGESKLTEALRARGQEYDKLIAKAQEESGKYVQAANTRIESEKKTVEYLRLREEALTGVAGAAEALAAKENEYAIQRESALVKESEATRSYKDEIAKLQDEVDKLNGVDQTRITLGANLRDGVSKEAQLRDKLRIAIVSNNQTDIMGLNSKISLQDTLNQRLQREIDLYERKQVLSGAIVGFNENGPIYADSYRNQMAATGYVSNSQLSGSSGSSSSSGSSNGSNSPFVNVNDPFWSSFPSYDVGTSYVPRDMIAKIHKGEEIIPAGQSRAVISTGDIIITVQGGSTGSETAREIARAIYPELQKIAGNRLAA